MSDTIDRKDVTQESYEKMNPAEKTEFLGYKIFTPEEIAARDLAVKERCTAGFRFILESIVANSNLSVGSKASAEELEASYKDITNSFYQYVLDNGLTSNDAKEITTMVQQIALIVISRTLNELAVDMMRFNYGVVGENELFDVPVKDLGKIAQAATDAKKAAEAKTAA